MSNTQELPNNQQFQPAGSYSNRDQQLESFEPTHMMQSIEDDQVHPLMVQNFFNTNPGSNTYPASSPFPDEMLKNLYPPQGNNQDQMQQDQGNQIERQMIFKSNVTTGSLNSPQMPQSDTAQSMQ